MVAHKAAQSQKRKAAKELKDMSTGNENPTKALTTATLPSGNKPKISGGLSRSKSTSKSLNSSGDKSSMAQWCTPMRRTSSEKPGHRAVLLWREQNSGNYKRHSLYHSRRLLLVPLKKSLVLVTIKRCCNNPWLFLHALRGWWI